MAGSQGKKSKKAGRNALRCKSYKDRNQRERNKILRLNRHLKKQPEDAAVATMIENLKKIVKGF